MVFNFSGKSLGILLPILAGLLVFGCSGNNSYDNEESVRSVTGEITYARLPIKVDGNGYPLGLDSHDAAEMMPLRGILVRVVYPTEETMPDESKVTVWRVWDQTYTDYEGKYTLYLPEEDTQSAFIEALSIFSYPGYRVRVVADPRGINSQVPQADRVLYSLRKGLDGTLQETNPIHATAKAGKIELDFEIGLNDRWWITHQSEKFANEAELEIFGSGSKVAAIIDTIYKASDWIGNPSPGTTLHLHYRQNIAEPFGTYVEYNRERFPLAYEPSSSTGGGELHYFGSVRGGPGVENDDAWDEGALLSMMARNAIRNFQVPARFQFPSKKFPDINDGRNQQIISSLQPTMAMAEGLPDAIAAIVLKTPFITSGSGTAVRDIRTIEGSPRNIYSGPAIAAFTWELALKANGIDSPGHPETWKEINSLAIMRFYTLQYEATYDDDSGYSEITDLPSLFTQLGRLSNDIVETETIDLAEIFTDEIVTQMTTPFFGEIWPRPKEGPLSNFIVDWGHDPDSAVEELPDFIFSMSDSVLDAEGLFCSQTYQENYSAKLRLSKDTAYRLSVIPNPPLPSGASIEVRINGNALSSFLFSNSSPDPKRIVLTGNSDNATSYMFDFSIKSPNIRLTDTSITVRLHPAY